MNLKQTLLAILCGFLGMMLVFVMGLFSLDAVHVNASRATDYPTVVPALAAVFCLAAFAGGFVAAQLLQRARPLHALALAFPFAAVALVDDNGITLLTAGITAVCALLGGIVNVYGKKWIRLVAVAGVVALAGLAGQVERIHKAPAVGALAAVDLRLDGPSRTEWAWGELLGTSGRRAETPAPAGGHEVLYYNVVSLEFAPDRGLAAITAEPPYSGTVHGLRLGTTVDAARAVLAGQGWTAAGVAPAAPGEIPADGLRHHFHQGPLRLILVVDDAERIRAIRARSDAARRP